MSPLIIRMKERTYLFLTTSSTGVICILLASFGEFIGNTERFLLIITAFVNLYMFIHLFDIGFYYRHHKAIFWILFVSVIVSSYIPLKESLTKMTSPQPLVSTRPTGKPLPSPDSTILAFIAHATQTQKNYAAANPIQPLPPTRTINPTKACTKWSAISLKDYGKSMCIEGIVLDNFFNQDVYYITFGKSPQDFYVLSYDFYYPDLRKGDCVWVRGEVKQIGQAPVIALADPKKLTGCP